MPIPAERKRRLFLLRWWPLGLAILLVAAILTANATGHISFHYLRAVNNDPLLAPVLVVSVQGDDLHLEDGRVIHVHDAGQSLDQAMKASDNRIDVERKRGTDELIVYGRERGMICRGPYSGKLLTIPLIADTVELNRRAIIGFGTMVRPPDQR
jgi:hypothetical protein